VAYRKDVYTAATFAAVRKNVTQVCNKKLLKNNTSKSEFYIRSTATLAFSSSFLLPVGATLLTHTAGDYSGIAHPKSPQGDTGHCRYCTGVPLIGRREA